MRWFFRPDYRSFHLLNATQFLGALNDNVFKLLVIYLLINLQGASCAPAILSLAGAIFVIPFLLFSSGAGVLADRLSKRTIIVAAKIMEVLIMVFGGVAVYFEWVFGAYAALFLMASQSALFGPSKYGIIPELVDEARVSKANGSITSFTYLAIILGTFLASFITDISNKNFLLLSYCCVATAVMGLLTSLGIAKTKPQRSSKRINPFFFYEIYQTLKASRKVPHLMTAIFGSSFFLLIGAFTQLNIIPFAMQSLHLSEVGGGYLFLATAVGIAAGALVSGQLSKDEVEPGISCVAGFFIAIFFFTLALFSSSLTIVIISLALLGFVGGGFLIPFDSFIQINSPDATRGRIIAASNFFSFIGVLFASLFLYLISEKWRFSAASGFFLIGCLSLCVDLFLLGRLSAFFLPFFVQKIWVRFHPVKVAAPLPRPSDLVVIQSSSWADILLLFSCLPQLKILSANPRFHRFPWINGWIDSIRIIPPTPESSFPFQNLFKEARAFQDKNHSVCLLFPREIAPAQIISAYQQIFGKLERGIVFVHGMKEELSKKRTFFRCKTRLHLTFTRKD